MFPQFSSEVVTVPLTFTGVNTCRHEKSQLQTLINIISQLRALFNQIFIVSHSNIDLSIPLYLLYCNIATREVYRCSFGIGMEIGKSYGYLWEIAS